MKLRASDGPPALPTAFRGRVYVRANRWGLQALPWPAKRGPARSGFALYHELEFGRVAWQSARPAALDLDTAKAWTAGTNYVPRDMLMMCSYGTFYELVEPDGSTWKGARLSNPNPQYILDLVTDEVGAVLFRSAVGWVGLPPPAETGLVLTYIDAGEVAWLPPPGSAGGSPDYAPPLAAEFPYSIGSPTLADTDLGLGITGPAASTQVYAALKDIPSGDWSVTARVQSQTWEWNYHQAGLVARDSASGRLLVACGTQLDSSNDWKTTYELGQYNSPTSWQGGTGGNLSTSQKWAWLRLAYTASTNTFTMWASLDGVHWQQINTDNSWLSAPDQIGVFVAARSTSGPAAGAVTWWGEA